MSMNDDPTISEFVERLRDTYNVPADTPREEMWAAIAPHLTSAAHEGAGKETSALAEADTSTLDLAEARKRRERSRGGPVPAYHFAGWTVAAAVVLILGIGLGHLATPQASDPVGPTGVQSGTGSSVTSPGLAAQAHLGETESLLTLVRADARDGRVDPATARWAAELLTQTRLLLDAQDGESQAMNDLLLDLELVLVQIIGVAETGVADGARARTELELALRSLDGGAVLSRIQAVMPAGLSGG